MCNIFLFLLINLIIVNGIVNHNIYNYRKKSVIQKSVIQKFHIKITSKIQNYFNILVFNIYQHILNTNDNEMILIIISFL